MNAKQEEALAVRHKPDAPKNSTNRITAIRAAISARYGMLATLFPNSSA